MKNLIFIVLLSCSLNMIAQQEDNSMLKLLQSEKDSVALQKKVEELENSTAADLMVLFQFYKKNPEKQDRIVRLINTNYPQSEQARMSRVYSFLNIKDAEEIEAHYNELRTTYPEVNMDMEKNLLAMTFAEVPDVSKVNKYLKEIEDPVYQILAADLNINLLAPIDQSEALALGSKMVDKAKKLKGDTSPSEILKADPQYAYNSFLSSYGKLLFKAGEDTKAYKYVKEAHQNVEEKDAELTEVYAFLSASIDKNYEESLPVLAKALQGGKTDSRYVDLVRTAYKEMHPDKDVDAYIESLQSVFKNKIRDQVAGKMIDIPAPQFYVTDVNGKKVTLEDFKGKIILLDFWATWCIPCVEAFPAMQLAANQYQNDPDVEFLFIHTWDNVKDPLNDAKNFLANRNYDFDLYMDRADPETRHSPAADAFGINGIPAKFIIDGKGIIRFEVSGFSGTDEEVAEEMVQMIEMVRGNS